jgi:23S rRNA (adenine1618-N6)-methyltransferase
MSGKVLLSRSPKAVDSPLHPRNLHREGYAFAALVVSYPALLPFVIETVHGSQSIDFADPLAVKALNAALLCHHYQIPLWGLPEAYLCPPVPGRADYIHYIADLLALSNNSEIPTGKKVVGLDIGTGANLIYPIIGSQSYGWRFIGSEIDKVASECAQMIAKANPVLTGLVSVRHQHSSGTIFDGIIQPQDYFAFTMCNPPFFSSAEQAMQANQTKNIKLARHKNKRLSGSESKGQGHMEFKSKSNFAGRANELYCPGGELAFISAMIKQSKNYAEQVGWFTTLVSNKDHLPPLYKQLKACGMTEMRTIAMAQGQKQSRFVAWRF